MLEEEKQRRANIVRTKNVIEQQISPEYREYLNKVVVSEEYLELKGEKTHFFLVRAKNCKSLCPAFINLHGGGFVRPHEERDIIFSAMLADGIGGLGLDLDYKLAPEYPFPVAFNETYATVQWFFSHAEELDIDPTRIFIIGHSAGGNLATAIAIKANQTKDFQLSFQILDYIPTDLVTDPAEKPEAAASKISPERGRIFNELYTDGDTNVARSPYASMAFAPKDMLNGLPPAVVITAGKDNLRFEAEQYANNLIDAGITVVSRRFLSSKHGFVILCHDQWKEAQQFIVQMANSFLEK